MAYTFDAEALTAPALAFKQLRAALESGELELATRCYAVVRKFAPPAAGAPDAVSAAFDEVGLVISEGDLGKSQVAFEVLAALLRASESTHPPADNASKGTVAAPHKVNIVG